MTNGMTNIPCQTVAYRVTDRWMDQWTVERMDRLSDRPTDGLSEKRKTLIATTLNVIVLAQSCKHA